MIFDASSLNFKIESVQNVGQTYHQTNTQGSHFWSVVWICLKLINYKGGDVSDGPMFLINLVPIGNPYLFFLINLILIRNPYIPVDSKDPSMDQLKQRKLVCSFRFEIFQLRTFPKILYPCSSFDQNTFDNFNPKMYAKCIFEKRLNSCSRLEKALKKGERWHQKVQKHMSSGHWIIWWFQSKDWKGRYSINIQSIVGKVFSRLMNNERREGRSQAGPKWLLVLYNINIILI